MKQTARRFGSMLVMALLSAVAGCADSAEPASGTADNGEGGAGGAGARGDAATAADTDSQADTGTDPTGDAGHTPLVEAGSEGTDGDADVADDADVDPTDGGGNVVDGDAGAEGGVDANDTVVEPEPTRKVLNIHYEAQPNGWWCGPTATRIALSARMSSPPSLQWLADDLPTTVNGTDWIGQVTKTLNKVLKAERYRTTEMPNDPPTQAQHDQLWDDIMVSIGNNYALVTNIVAPPSNHPPGYPNNETIYHYFAVVGYDSDAMKVYIADPASFAGNQLYWLTFDQLATLIPPKGYSSYKCPEGMTSGPIDAKFRALGGCRSVVGGPVSAEAAASDGVGKYNEFEKGVIYWTAATGAHEVHGAILTKWKDLGREGSSLGYPTSDEYVVAGGRRSDFQHGSLTWTESSGDVTQQ